MLRVVDKIVALMGSLLPADIDALPPVQRQMLADRCRRVIDLAEPKPRPRNGILADLGNGVRPD